MKRLEYFNTQKGQLYLRRKRQMSRLYFLRINQEPKSKNSISTSEKIYFQNEILKVLSKRRRRAYRSPVIVKIDFHSNQDNPPSIHTLAKNYLDLLEDPIPQSKIKRNKLLYNDDKLIKILIVNYHLGMPSFRSSISIKIDTLSNFISDIELVDRIKKNDFEKDDNYSWSSSCTFSDFNTDEFDNHDDYFDTLITQLRELERDKHSIVKKFSREIYEIQKGWLIKDVQKRYLKTSELKTDQLLILFSGFLNKRKDYSGFSRLLANLDKQNRNLIISPTFTIDLTHAPSQKGGKTIFKNNVKRVLNSFKRKHPILFPLRNQISITVLYVPPKNQSIDLDNLARYIIPFINDIIMPPSTFLNTIDINHMKDSDIKERLLEYIKKIPKIPKYSITKYQVIVLSRFDNDPDEGYVRLIFGDGFDYSGLWDKTDDIIDKWENYID